MGPPVSMVGGARQAKAVAVDLSGVTLGGYRVEARLGDGSVATVYRASRLAGGPPVALKVLDTELTRQPGYLPGLLARAGALGGLRHPGVLPVYEIEAGGPLTYLIMRLAAGSLRGRLAAAPMRLDEALALLTRLGEGLDAAHRAGLLHLDLKPGNVLLDARGDAMLGDFGLARTWYGCARGTPGYMAPEQAMGLDLDRRTDVFGLALLAFEVLTGAPAHEPGSPIELVRAAVEAPVPWLSERRPELPRELGRVLGRALAKDPGDRQPAVGVLLAELQAAAGVAQVRRPPANGAANGAATASPALLPVPPAAPVRLRYELEAACSQVSFSYSFMRFLRVHGIFRDFSGRLELEGDDASSARLECRIRVASLDTGNEERDRHLQGEEFLDAAGHPEIRFRSTSVRPQGDDRLSLVGDLMIRAVTLPVGLEARIVDRESEPGGGERVSCRATAVLRWPDWLDQGGGLNLAGRFFVGDSIEIDLTTTWARP